MLPVCLCFASTFGRGVDFGRGWIELHYRFGGLAHFFRRCFARGFDSPLRSLLLPLCFADLRSSLCSFDIFGTELAQVVGALTPHQIPEIPKILSRFNAPSGFSAYILARTPKFWSELFGKPE